MVLQVNIDQNQADPLLMQSGGTLVNGGGINNLTNVGSSGSLPRSLPTTPLSPSAPISFFEVKVDNIGYPKPPSTPTTPFAKRQLSTKKSATIHEDYEGEELRDDESYRSNHSSPPQYFELNQLQIAANGRRPPKGMYRREESCASSVYRQSTMGTTEHFKQQGYWMSDAVDSLTMVLSALYAKLLVIIGLCFPMAEVISHRIPIGWYEGFYLYLYLGSIVFLFLIYACREGKKKKHRNSCLSPLKAIFCWMRDTPDDSRPETPTDSRDKPRFQISSTESSIADDQPVTSPIISTSVHFGSFYLRLGAVAFGIGSMIYSGLEFGQFFELESKEHCYSFLYGFTPSSHMAFTFFQLYFIFMNSRVFITKHNLLGESMKNLLYSRTASSSSRL